MLSILWFAKDHPKVTSAYGKCVREIVCNRLVKWTDHKIALFVTVPSLTFHDEYKGVPIYTGIGEDLWEGSDSLMDNYYEWQRKNPDLKQIYFTQMDVWIMKHVPQLAMEQKINWLSYCPIDFYPIPQYVIDKLRSATAVVAMNRWARDELKKYLDNVIGYIYHGVTEQYRPLADTKEEIFKKFPQSRKSLGADEDDFLISIIAMNQTRKIWDKWLEGIRLFIDANPDIKTKIYCHCQAAVKEGFNIPELLKFYGLAEITRICNPYRFFHCMYSDEDIVRIYNVSNVLLIPNVEGFSIPVIESLACGTPVIGLDFGSQKELLEPTTPELLVKVDGWYMFAWPMLRKPLPSPDDICRKLEIVARHDPNCYLRRGYEIGKQFHWDNIVKEGFIPMLEQVEDLLEERCVKAPLGVSKEIRVVK